ncbi:MAG: DUF1326 domain-containing protein [Gammaproteobacteria bacterium]
MASNWSLEGNYFESCTCDLVCPCIFLMPPTKGYCNALVGWKIEKGHLGEVKLDGVKVAVYLEAPGMLTEGGWKINLYIDNDATEMQVMAISELWCGKHGGHLSVIAGLISEVKTVEQAPIEFTIDGKKRHLKVGKVGENEMYTIDGEDGGDVVINNHPLAIAPGNPISVAKSKKTWYRSNGIDHTHSNTVGLAAAFQYSA